MDSSTPYEGPISVVPIPDNCVLGKYQTTLSCGFFPQALSTIEVLQTSTEDAIDKNPFANFERVKSPGGRREAFTLEQLRCFVDVLTG